MALNGNVLIADGTLNGNLGNNTQTLSGTLSVHWGADGTPGKDGISPIISVFKEDEETYILQITDANGTYLTPNLKGEDGEFAGKKIDENLEKYRLVNPVTLNVSQRNSAFLYVRRSDENEGTKVSLNTLALKEEVDEQISRKIRTEKDRTKASWQVGDYIFLEKN